VGAATRRAVSRAIPVLVLAAAAHRLISSGARRRGASMGQEYLVMVRVETRGFEAPDGRYEGGE